MSNILNKIQYAVEIFTNTTTSVPDIGLNDGYIRFVTDNYDTTISAKYEDNTDVTGIWSSDFITKNSLPKLGSKISIVEGGDYAFLPNANIQIANVTPAGDQYHDKLFTNLGVFITGSTLKIYVIIDDVFYVRWSGVITGTRFSDQTFEFLGSDRHINENDTLSNVKYGYVIGSEFVYSAVSPTPYRTGIVMNSFGPDIYGVPLVKDLSTGGHPLRLFSGFSNSSTYDLETPIKKTIQIRSTTESVAFMTDQVDLLDLIQINQSSNFYEILSWESVYTIESGDLIEITVRSYDEQLADYNSCYGFANKFDPNGEVFAALSTVEGSALLSFYKPASNTGIPATLVDGEFVTIMDDKGNSVKKTYTVMPNGTIRLDDEVYTTSLVPSSVSMYDSAVPLNYYSGALPSYTLPSDDSFNRISLPNSLNETDAMISISVGNTALFKLKFDEDIVEDDGWQIATMVQGIFDNQNMNWQQKTGNPAIGDGWYKLIEKTTWDGGGAVNTLPDIKFDTAEKLSGARFNNFKVTVCRIVTVFDSTEKQFISPSYSFYLPNAVVSTYVDADSNNWDHIENKVKSIIATNVLKTNPDIYSTALGIRKISNFAGFTPGTGRSIQDGILEFGKAGKVSTNELIIAIEGYDNDIEDQLNGSKEITVVSDANVTTTYTTDPELAVDNLQFRLNGFNLIRTETLTQSENKINIITNDVTTNSYVELLQAISNTTIDVTKVINRDDWLSGCTVVEPTPRFNLITKLCKQGFVTGFSSRDGIPTFSTFLESIMTPEYLNDSIIIRNTIKNFTNTDINRVYNEFYIKWNQNLATNEFISEVNIKNVNEDTFPLISGNWTEYVSGISDYTTAKYFWDLASQAEKVSSAINKAPLDRTDLVFAYDELITDDKMYLGDSDSIVTFNVTDEFDEIIEVGSIVKLPYLHLPNNIIQVGDKIVVSNDTESMELIAFYDQVGVSSPKFLCTVISMVGISGVTTVTMDANKSYIIKNVGQVYAGVRQGEFPISGGMINQQVLEQVGSTDKWRVLKSSLNTPLYVGDTIHLCQPDSTNRAANRFTVIKITGNLPTDSNYWETTIEEVNDWEFNSNTWAFTKQASWFVRVKQGSVPNFTDGYARKYLDMLVKWTTYQKFQVDFDIPITPTTVKYELMTEVNFNDPIITPGDTYGAGWITGLTLDPKAHVFKVQITFDPSFYIKAPVVLQNKWIDEKATNVKYINEDKDNIKFINEQHFD